MTNLQGAIIGTLIYATGKALYMIFIRAKKVNIQSFQELTHDIFYHGGWIAALTFVLLISFFL